MRISYLYFCSLVHLYNICYNIIGMVKKLRYITKKDYLKLGKRTDVHTTIREDLYEELQIISIKSKEPLTKLFDVLIEETLKDEIKLKEFKNKIKIYR